MTITEPMTLATDYLIVAVALSLSWKLFKSWREDRIEGKRLWALALLFTGCGAFFGGTYHGFKEVLGETISDILWRLTLLSTGLVSLYMALGSIHTMTGSKYLKVARIVTGIKFAAYATTTIFFTKFLLVIIDYGSVMLFMFGLSAYIALKHKSQSAKLAVLAVITSFIAAAIQQLGPDLHQHFNHNDLYHIVQTGGVYLFYLSAKHAEYDKSVPGVRQAKPGERG